MEEVKQRAIDWLESREKNIEEGIAILHDAGTEKVVIEYYEKFRNKDVIRNKLSTDIRRVISKKIEIKEELKQPTFTLVENDEVASVETIKQTEYPNEVKAVLLAYNESYIKRSILHKHLKELGDNNSDEVVAKRKAIIEEIDILSKEQDILYKRFAEYLQTNILPPAPSPKQQEPQSVKTQTDYNALSLEELKKMKETNRVQLSRVNNQLKYQSFTKAKKENPLPQSPKRVKLEKKLAKLIQTKENIEMAIAQK